jgi:hypothetical protein
MRMNRLAPLRGIALVVVGAHVAVLALNHATVAQEAPCGDLPRPVYLRQATIVPAEPAAPSWIFARSTFTHDPSNGARVAQYMPIPPVEPLDDPREITSRYRRSRTNLRGTDGSVDTYYEVQQWGNGRGGIDAEWERFHDAWKDSYLSGSFYNQTPYGYASPHGGYGHGGGYGYGSGYGHGFPGYGFPPGYGGVPGYGYPPGYDGPPHGWQHHGGAHSGHND